MLNSFSRQSPVYLLLRQQVLSKRITTLALKNVATWILEPEQWFKSFPIYPPHYTSSFCGQSDADFYIRIANPKKKNGSAYYYCVSF